MSETSAMVLTETAGSAKPVSAAAISDADAAIRAALQAASTKKAGRAGKAENSPSAAQAKTDAPVRPTTEGPSGPSGNPGVVGAPAQPKILTRFVVWEFTAPNGDRVRDWMAVQGPVESLEAKLKEVATYVSNRIASRDLRIHFSAE